MFTTHGLTPDKMHCYKTHMSTLVPLTRSGPHLPSLSSASTSRQVSVFLFPFQPSKPVTGDLNTNQTSLMTFSVSLSATFVPFPLGCHGKHFFPVPVPPLPTLSFSHHLLIWEPRTGSECGPHTHIHTPTDTKQHLFKDTLILTYSLYITVAYVMSQFLITVTIIKHLYLSYIHSRWLLTMMIERTSMAKLTMILKAVINTFT